jgi:hypothetical protein
MEGGIRMNRIRLLCWAIILALLGSLTPAGLGTPAAFAEQAKHFKLEVQENEAGTNRELVVSVLGYNLADVYAYELHLQFDPTRLKLKEAASAIKGFTLGSQVEGDILKVAHTKVGPVAGDTGDIILATLTFQVLAGGDSELVLKEVQLVDSELNKTVDEVHVSLQVGQYVLIRFSDIAGHWAEDNIKKAVELGWVNGYEDGTFRPDRQITRAEFAKIIVIAKGLPLPSSEAPLPFADAGSIPRWARPYIAAAAEAGWLRGYEDGTFRANERLTRAELAAIIVRAAGLNAAAEARTTFADADQIPAWAHPYAAAGVQAGLIRGKLNNRFAASDDTTRAEAVTILLR